MSIPAFEIEFNKEGNEVDPHQLDAAIAGIKAAAATDLLVISHGWNNDIADWPYTGSHSTAASQAQGASGPPAGELPWSNWQFWQYDDQNVAQTYTTGDGDIFNGTLATLTNTMVAIANSNAANSTIYYWDPQGTTGATPYTGS